MKQYIVVYRPHGALNLETKHFGPFTSFHDANTCIESLPAIGCNPDPENENHGCKYITELHTLAA